MREDLQARSHVSPLNFVSDVRNALHFPEKVLLYDVTLRDGEQTPGVVFNVQDRLEIVRALDRLGVHRIEAGFPLISDEDRRGVEAVANADLRAEVWGFGRCLPTDVEANAACGVKNVLLEISISDLKMAAYGLTRDQVIKRMLTSLEKAQQLGLRTAFMPVDLTRADLTFAEKVVRLAVEEGGASEIIVVDTIGVTSPEAMAYLTGLVRSWVDVPLGVHCHNDFGLGVANTLAALKSGAHCAHVSINGLGERAGNVDLAELVMALELLYGVDTGVATEYLTETARLVERISGQCVSPTKPVVGERIFMRETGGVVQQLLVSPPAVEPYDPALVGQQRSVALGKKSGKWSILHVLDRLGIELSDDETVQRLLAEVKRLSTSERRLVTEEEFRELVRRVVQGAGSFGSMSSSV